MLLSVKNYNMVIISFVILFNQLYVSFALKLLKRLKDKRYRRCSCIDVVFRLIGAFLKYSPQYSFVIEDHEGICGYVLAALDAKDFTDKLEKDWLPAMQLKYPKPETSSPGELTPAEVSSKLAIFILYLTAFVELQYIFSICKLW